MVWTCVDYALDQLSEIQLYQYELDTRIDHRLYDDVRYLWIRAGLGDMGRDCNPWERIHRNDAYWEEYYGQIESYKRELMFLKTMFWCFATLDDTDPNVRCMLTALESLWEDLEERIGDTISWNHGRNFLASCLEGTIQKCKPLIVDYCQILLGSLFQYKPLPSHETLQFLQDVVHNLEVLVRYRANAISSVKIQFDSLKSRVNLLRDFFQLITAHGGINFEEFRELEFYLRSFAINAACLAFLFWAKPASGEIAVEAKIKEILSEMREKVCKPCRSDGMALYLGVLKPIKLHPTDDTLLHGQVVAGFVDLHIGYPVAASKENWLIVQDGLIFLLSFMTNPPQGCDQDDHLDSVCMEIDLLFDKCVHLIRSPHVVTKENFTMDKMLFSEFPEKLDETMGKVKLLYVNIPNPLPYDFPRTNGLGFYDLLLLHLERLTEKMDNDTTFIPFLRKFIIKVEAHLLSLRPLVNSIFELQKEQKEFEGTWLQVVYLAYRTEHVINSCLVQMHPVWYNMASLCDILDQIDEVKIKIEKLGVEREIQMVKSYKMHHTKNPPPSLPSYSKPLERNWFSMTSEEEAISREEETKIITDELLGGYESLGIISIIGMGGLGKTTLAKEIYDSKTARCHFHKRGFSSVSQVLNKRNFFVDILHGIGNGEKEKFDSMTEDDLAHHLWRCLSGQTYLIVIDDIWDIEAWDAVKSSFPDDKNKSRIILTTRERKVALDAKSSLHNLRPLSDDESLRLLHLKVFGKGDCSLIPFEVEKIIARNCKGLPLSIVVVAGLLASNKTSSCWWEEIAEATSRFVGVECREIIGYSYQHLPEHLKSCFLYMAIFGEDEWIQTKQLRDLWISEGLVKKSITKSTRIMAKEHLEDLVNRNLVTVVLSSCGGGIRTCRLHDVIRDFCRQQAEEDNFLYLGDGYGVSNSSNSRFRNLYRISIQRSFDDIELAIVDNVHSLLCRGRNIPKLTKFDLEKLKLVQVLHFEGDAQFSSHLVHLRYISVKHWHGEGLPESICNLWNLETVIIKESDVVLVLPKTIWKMKRLRHLEFGNGCVFDLDKDEDEGRQLSLDNMEFLSKLYLYSDRSTRVVLPRLPNIQKLTCVLVDSKSSDNSDWRLFTTDFLGKLDSLNLHSKVKTSKVFRFPSTLRRLVFEAENGFSQHTLSSIGELSCLEVLKLEGSLTRWDVEDGHFQKLKYLKMDLPYLETWDVSFYSFSCLQHLNLGEVKYLDEIPGCFAELPTLQMIEIGFCQEGLKRSAIQVQEEQMDNGNRLELRIFPDYDFAVCDHAEGNPNACAIS